MDDFELADHQREVLSEATRVEYHDDAEGEVFLELNDGSEANQHDCGLVVIGVTGLVQAPFAPFEARKFARELELTHTWEDGHEVYTIVEAIRDYADHQEGEISEAELVEKWSEFFDAEQPG